LKSSSTDPAIIHNRRQAVTWLCENW